MKNQINNSIFIYGSLLFLLPLLHSTTFTVTAQLVANEREFDYTEGSEKGPSKWGELKKEWATCKDGKMQSPIDMSNQKVKIIPQCNPLKQEYKPCNAAIKNRGHDIMVEWIGDAGSIQINGTIYPLRQAHWHSPSEHSINGRRFEMELHMVHQSTENKIAVVSVLYEIGTPDPFLSKLTSTISSVIDKLEERNYGEINPREITTDGKSYYRYMGSLTAPPCTEGVIWTINKKVRTVSGDQVNLLRQAVHDYAEKNARPLQPDNGRDIHLYGSPEI